MGNSRKVWLACGAAVGLPLSGLAQDVKQVQVSETNGRVEIHVIGANLPKPTNVTWKKDVAYTLEWKAGLKSPGGRIRVDSGNVKSVWYGWFSSHPHTMRVRVQSKSAVHPDLKQDAEGWVITIGGNAATTLAKNSNTSSIKKSDDSWSAAAGELMSSLPPAKSRVALVTSAEQTLPLEKAHRKVSAREQGSQENIVKVFPPIVPTGAPTIVDSPAMKKWTLVEQLDKAQIKKSTLAPLPISEPIRSLANGTVALDMSDHQNGLRKVSLDCSNADLAQVLKGLAMQSGANIVIGPSVTGKVTADLHDVTIDQALKYVSYLTGVKYEKADGIYMFGTVPQEHVVENVQVSTGFRVVSIQSDGVEAVKRVLDAEFLGQGLQVQINAPVSASSAGSNNYSASDHYLVLIGPDRVIDDAAGVAQGIDRDIARSEKRVDVSREMVAYDVKFADPRALRESLISEVPGLRAVIAPNSVGTFQTFTEGKAKRQSAEEVAAEASGQGAGQASAQQTQTQATGTVSTQISDDTSLEQPFSKEEGLSVPMKLVLRGTHEQIQQALDYLRMLDTPPKQVALELRVMELTKQDALNAGIDWNILTGGAVKILNLNNSQASPHNTAGISLSGNNFNGDVTVSLDALAEKNKMLARPNLVAMDGRQSEIFIGDIIRYVESIQATQNGTTVTTGEVPVGVRLSVLPRVGADGNMTLDLRPRISLLTSFTPVTGGGELPQTSSRFAQSTISLHSGQTLAIGGLIQDQDIKTLSGIPVLMNLPIIGSLFRSTTLSKQRTELVIFLTARTINGPVGAESLPMMPDSVFGGKGGKN